jgi:formylglycine-generating enzyme required for sulfatase activity
LTAAAEVQGLILESGKQAGILAADVVESCRATKRDRATATASPLLKLIQERAGLSKQDLDRLLEKFWAQNGAKRAMLHRRVEERIVASYLVEANITQEAKVAVAEQELDERSSGGDPVRLLSILVDNGTIDENAARQTVTEVQKVWKFCKYCLSSFKIAEGANGGDACSICGRPLTVAARTYEIIKTQTIATDASSKKGPSPAGGAAGGTTADTAKSPAVKLPEAGDTLAGVKLLERVDQAGRGAVYKGERTSDQALRAVKVWQLGKDLGLDDVARFETAALSATKLDHPGILKIFEASEERGVHFVISEWVAGKTLRKLIESKGPLETPKAADVLEGVLKALEAAHKQSLLHKNVTPGNIFVLDAGGTKISDFGVCKDYGVSLDTVRGNVIGSPDYLAPEQCQGLKSDERTDLFSLGAAMYFALSGKKPFVADSTVSLVVKRLTTDPEPLSKVAPKVSKEFADIVMKLMARKPEERYGSAREALQAVERWKARVEAGLEGIVEMPLWKKAAIGVAALAGVGAVVGGVIYLLTFLAGPNEAFVREVRESAQLAERGLFVQALEKLRPLADREGEGGEAAHALDEVGGRALARSNELAKDKDFPGALDLLDRAKPYVAGFGLKSEVAIVELEKSLRERRATYEAGAEEAWKQLQKDVAKARAAEALAKIREYREKWPHQPRDKNAAEDEEKLAALERQADLFVEAEQLVAAGDPEGAKARLSDAIAISELDERNQARKRRIDKGIAFAEQMKEGERLSAAGEVAKAVDAFNAAATIFPDRPEVRAAIAKAEYDDLIRKAQAEEGARNLIEAQKLYEKARQKAGEAMIDRTTIEAKVKAVAEAVRTAKEREGRSAQKIAEGDRARQLQDWGAALKAYVEAQKLAGSTPLLEDRIAEARANAGAASEEKEWKVMEARVARAPKAAEKVAMLREFLELFPEGNYAPVARELLEKFRAEGKVVDTEKSVAATLRRGDRPGEYVNPADGATMVLVPAGKFKRGTSSAAQKALAERWGVDMKMFADETPEREIHVEAFYISVSEVSNADYALFLAAIEAEKEKPHKWCNPQEPPQKIHIPKYWHDERWTRSDMPVVGVDWWDAWAYAKWSGQRLPTEAEWEKAARGTDGRVYPWGDAEQPFLANTAEAWFGRTFTSRADWQKAFYEKKPWTEKGLTAGSASFPSDRSPYGCMHLGGNVWEWCEDWYHSDAYLKLGEKNPVASTPGKTKHRVVRGGAWVDPLYLCRAASRAHHLEPSERNLLTGFRCARSTGK